MMTTAQHFSNDPADARRMFLAACLDARLSVASFEAPRDEHAEYPVHIDVARAGRADAETSIILCPGSRMAEGLCTSGIQTSALRTGMQTELPDSAALVLVHMALPSAFKADVWEGSTESSAETKEWDDALLAAAEFRFNEDRSKKDIETIEDNVLQKWCRHVLDNVAQRFLSSSRHIVLIDVRTGSGPYAEAEVVSCHLPGSEDEARASEMFGARGMVNGNAIANLQGPVARGLATALPDRQTTAVVMEFGCYSLTTVLDSLLSRYESEVAGTGRFGGLFYPDAADWRERVWGGAAEILRLGFRFIDQAGSTASPNKRHI
ncbi:MAG: hypothetical protein CFH10_00368 [Alphaproteobacteria bacterium MarineAlpha4_Bin2]|nr:MAG: hypothetical protein CFH10_00368 [Alphaproteobacteria bacterium MarineAlpha4_Bin2]